jgi:hypothetical protein
MGMPEEYHKITAMNGYLFVADRSLNQGCYPDALENYAAYRFDHGTGRR